ncbi:two-component system OmpR family sensor kinase [Malaciobacter marinus]|jgi:two-component system OmpR family sensor kinase|uniref:histidine kinase n=1 Tax=Malaciobacter marinus TaxID=505249 RepID=A0AB36ZUR5_9BACT|nr:ArsS family sensor histidine kinase [Malaciobacter marinus]PPK60569.1 two-component system OmpR family sensor kinase [Malaciobacter marinus]SKB51556.1 two-component system, OmpR family, sensor kinase [Malaciobacter marinus]
MIKNISISSFINAIFTIAFVAILITFALFINLDMQKHQITQKNRYEIIAENFLSVFNKKPSKSQLDKLYDQFKVKQVKNREEKLKILNDGYELLIKKTYLGTYRIYLYDSEYYLYAQQLGYNLMLKDLHSNKYNIAVIILILVLSLSTILFLYIILKRKLKPLKELNCEITKFSKGDLNIKIKPKSNDEIGEIAKNFDAAITLINNQSESKNLFMRNMMHELKTPITKAMFIAETLEDERSKMMLQKAFKRMDDIIKELATVERITSKTSVLYKEITSFFNIYRKTLDIMMIEPSNISSKINDFTFEVDISLFSVALKNLLDNGIKFSTDKKVSVIANKKRIDVISKGCELKYKLDYYTEPFSQEEKRADGFGLGLYIVKTIVNMHKYKLKYSYKDGYNYFSIITA